MNPVDRRPFRLSLTLLCFIGSIFSPRNSGALVAPQNTPSSERPILVGQITKADLQKAPFVDWFDAQYSRYEPKSAELASLRSSLDGVSIEAYFGTWCGDSRRQIPRLLRLLELAGLNEQRISLITLSDRPMEFKQAPGNPEAKRRIHRTPTIVVVRAGSEIGRIVETPITSLEADLLAILQGTGQAPHYGAEAWVHNLFADLAPSDVEKALLSGGPEALKRGESDSLWHYAEFDLLKNGRAREATAVLDLHLRLNPKSVIGHVLLSEALSALGRRDEALAAIERALSLEPQDKRARSTSETLRRH